MAKQVHSRVRLITRGTAGHRPQGKSNARYNTAYKDKGEKKGRHSLCSRYALPRRTTERHIHHMDGAQRDLRMQVGRNLYDVQCDREVGGKCAGYFSCHLLLLFPHNVVKITHVYVSLKNARDHNVQVEYL